MTAAVSDVAASLVGRLREQLRVDDDFALEAPGGFRWWPFEIAQDVRVARDGETARLDVASALLPAGPWDDDALVALAGLMRYPALSAFRLAPDGALALGAAAVVGEDAAPLLFPVAALAAMLQATYAQLGLERLEALARRVAARPDHPRSGTRPAPHVVLGVARDYVVPAGEESSRFAEAEEWIGAVRALLDSHARASARDSGVDARFPFHDAASGDPFGPRVSSLLQIRAHEVHPELGNGAFVRLFVPLFERDRGAAPLARLALELNAREAADDARLAGIWGSWTVERPEPAATDFALEGGPARLAHVTFLPNFSHRPGLLTFVALESAARAAWARDVLTGAA